MTRLVVILLALLALPAMAADYEIEMLNTGSDGRSMVFEPAFLRIEPGDTVHFVATNRSHNAEIVPGMIPEGAEPFRGRLNEEISVTFTVEGGYGIQCKPHLGMGMVALIVVGDAEPDLDAWRALRLPRGAHTAFEALYLEMAATTKE